MIMKKIFILLTFIALLFSSCSDFLTEIPKHDWELESAMTTYNSAVQAVNGIYGRIAPGDDMNQELFCAMTTKSGLLKLTGGGEFNFSYTQSTSTTLWAPAYKAINAANLAVTKIPGITDSAFPNNTKKTELIAEARCLRGYVYSLLLLNYCQWYDSSSKYGLVYKDQVSDLTTTNVGRITVAESWDKVLEDLDYAIDNMSDGFESPRYVSKLFAKAWKAKLLLIRGCEWNSSEDIAAAKTLIDACIANIPSSVAVESDMADLYDKSWDSKENIFVRYLEDVSGRTYNAGYYSDYFFGYSAASNLSSSTGEAISITDAEMGIEYGHDWMSADPRWQIAISEQRTPETWDTSHKWIWSKIYRKGSYQGQQDPVDTKYACYYMRLPELYIMQAELRARTGSSLSESIAPINTYRSMRTNPVLKQIATPASKEELMDQIFKEYICELLLENGSELWASIRFEKDGQRYIEAIKGIPFDITKIQWAIPNEEMINNTALEGMQNPGQE